MTALQAAYEALTDTGYSMSGKELHHWRGRGKLGIPWDDILVLSVIPVSKQKHADAHLKHGKRHPFAVLLDEDSNELGALIKAMDRQIEILRLWKNVDRMYKL